MKIGTEICPTVPTIISNSLQFTVQYTCCSRYPAKHLLFGKLPISEIKFLPKRFVWTEFNELDYLKLHRYNLGAWYQVPHLFNVDKEALTFDPTTRRRHSFRVPRHPGSEPAAGPRIQVEAEWGQQDKLNRSGWGNAHHLYVYVVAYLD